jgi:hypothetical protein
VRGALGLVAATMIVAAPTTARADGDPCTDQLPFRPYCIPRVPAAAAPTAEARIAAATADAERQGLPLSVAVIAGVDDLGAVPQYAGRPAGYAPFLATELAFVLRGPLLVVMPEGYALANSHDPALRRAIEALPRPGSSDPTVLVNAGADAVVAAAASTGRTVSATPASGRGRSSPRLLLLAGVLLGGGVAAAAAVWAVRGPRRSAGA